MNRPRDPPTPYGQRGIDLDSDRRHPRGGPPQGPRNGPDMTNLRMPDCDEGIDDLVDDFDSMGMDPRERAARGRPQARPDPRHLDDMDAFNEEDIDPRRSSVRGGPQDRVGMGRGRMDHMDDFGEDEVGPRRPSTRRARQGRRGTGPGHMDEPVTDMVSYIPQGSRAGGSRTGVSRVGAGDSRAGGSRTGVSRVGGGSRAGGNYGARGMTNELSHVPRGIRGPRPPITHSVTPLRELEVELDRAEETKRRAEQISQTAKKSDLAFVRKQIDKAVWRSMKLKNEIYKIDPKSERVDNTARFFLHLPYNPDLDHGKKGAPHDHQSLASRRGGDRGRRGAHHDARDHY